MENYQKYFGGTGITLKKLKEVKDTISVDGTYYKIESWLKECIRFDALKPGVSKLWIPYNVWERGVVTEVVWKRYKFGDYSYWPAEMHDWWISIPHALVNSSEMEYYVYEISFYKRWKRKTQMKHILAQKKKPKRKFLSREEIISLKRQEVITNSKRK